MQCSVVAACVWHSSIWVHMYCRGLLRTWWLFVSSCSCFWSEACLPTATDRSLKPPLLLSSSTSILTDGQLLLLVWAKSGWQLLPPFAAQHKKWSPLCQSLHQQTCLENSSCAHNDPATTGREGAVQRRTTFSQRWVIITGLLRAGLEPAVNSWSKLPLLKQ